MNAAVNQKTFQQNSFLFLIIFEKKEKKIEISYSQILAHLL